MSDLFQAWIGVSMTVLSNVFPIGPATADGGPRLKLRSRGRQGEFVDGGWWPRSTDLTAELLPLLETMWADGYDIHRITYNLSAWDEAERRVVLSGHVIRLGGYRTQNPAMISLVDTTGWKRVDLVVIPPDTEPKLAQRALDLAGTDGDLRRCDEIVQAA